MKIVVSKDGPYVVSGNVPLSVQTITPNEEGDSWNWKEAKTFPPRDTYKLCRCGQSKTKPYCDNSHVRVGFDGTEAATRLPHAAQAESFDGPTLDLSDAEGLCASARFCHPGGGIWNLVEHSDDAAARKLAIREASHCPSGRLVLHDKKTGSLLEPELQPSIGLVEDPALGWSGPLWVRGGIKIESADGTPYEVRNRATLCRCGGSENKPFCDGSHCSDKFTDGLVEFAERKPG
jgi:CDGSH-type Zn-finger protein